MRNILVLLLIGLLVAGGGYFTYQQFFAKELAVEDVLPQEALLLFHLYDLETNMAKLTATPLWQAIEGLNYDLLLENKELPPQAETIVKIIRGQFFDESTKKVLNKFISREVAVAVYPVNVDLSAVSLTTMSDPQFIQNVFSGVYLVTRVDDQVQMVEYLARFFDEFGEDVAKDTIPYKDQTIHRFKFRSNEITMAAVRLKDLIIVGIGEQPIKNAIDIFKKEKLPLNKDSKFKAMAEKFFDEPGMTTYVNLDKLIGIFIDKVTAYAAADTNQEQIDAAKRMMNGFKSIGLSSQWKDYFKLNSFLTYNKNEMDAQVAKIYFTCQPEENHSINFIPGDVLAYQWASCFDLVNYWQQAQEAAAAQDGFDPAEQVKAMETALGLSIENELLPAFGNEIGGFLKDIRSGGMFPIPDLVLFIEVKDRSVVERLLSLLTNQPLLSLKTEQHEAVDINYFSSPLGAILEPGYCFIDQYFLVASDRKLLLSAIDTFKKKMPSLTANRDLQDVFNGFTDKGTGATFVRVKETLAKMEGVIEWGNDWADSSQKQKEAFQSGSQKRLDTVKEQLKENEDNLKALQETGKVLEEEAASLIAQGADASSKQSQIVDLKEKVKLTENEIEANKDSITELEGILTGYQDKGVSAETRKLYLDEVVYPVLNGMKSIRSLGSVTTMNDDSAESQMYLDL